MKKIHILSIILACVVVFGLGFTTIKERPNDVQKEIPCIDATATFNVIVGTTDCPALQNCDITVVVYYSTGAEVGSQTYVYGQSTYSFTLTIPPAPIVVCASLQVSNCSPGYNLTPVPNYVPGPYTPGWSYNIPLKYYCY